MVGVRAGTALAATVACLGLMAFEPQQARANLIVNGSFETPTDPPFVNGFAIFPSIPGWTGPGGVEIQRNSVLGPGNIASDGVQYTELNVNSPTSISQVIATDPGQTYILSFDYAARPGTGLNVATVSFTGNDLITLSELPGPTITWIPMSFLVTATGPTSTLTFTGVAPNTSLGNLIDRVSLVSAVPEPASLLLVVPAGLVLWAFRRKAA